MKKILIILFCMFIFSFSTEANETFSVKKWNIEGLEIIEYYDEDLNLITEVRGIGTKNNRNYDNNNTSTQNDEPNEQQQSLLKDLFNKAALRKKFDDIVTSLEEAKNPKWWKGNTTITDGEIYGFNLFILLTDQKTTSPSKTYSHLTDWMEFITRQKNLTSFSSELNAFRNFVTKKLPEKKYEAISFLENLYHKEWASKEAQTRDKEKIVEILKDLQNIPE